MVATPPAHKLTPMMQQYLEIKARYPDALLLYRMGDFYELFMDDAVTASRILEIALTSRDRQAENPVPMCGVPYHAAESYIPRLITAGMKVAICDQVEDPKKAKGLVKREVTRVITPGLILDNRNLTAKQPNYLAAVRPPSGKNRGFGLSFIDVSTAEFRAVEPDSQETLLEELAGIAPRELLVSEEDEGAWLEMFLRRFPVAVTRISPEEFDTRRAEERLIRHFGVHSLEGFGLDGMGPGISAAGAVLSYVRANLLDECGHITRLLPHRRADYMVLDEATVRNLEIFQSQSFQGRKGSLLSILDETRTAMGGRRLRQRLRYPLIDAARIAVRRQGVSELVEQGPIRARMLDLLSQINDIERLDAKNSTGMAGPRDLVAVMKSLRVLPHLLECLSGCMSPLLTELASSWDNLADVAGLIEATLEDPPPAVPASGGVIRRGVDEELDRYTRMSTDARGWMAEYETNERRRTGIGSLKVRYNKVFGYYIEISNANRASVPDEYYRKQTLVNAERFTTEELKTFEVQVLTADEKRLEIEQRLFAGLRRAVAAQGDRIRRMADSVARLDCTAALAEAAARYDYCRPHLDDGDDIVIRDGRHPVIERFVENGTFVPNDLELRREDGQVLIITGPNMAGKSTMLRQAALIVLMAQIGSFVPATEARIGIVDRIFTRVGASDDLARGRSTFMVEMQETAGILHQATSKSFVILDEIGRGTSTFDGLSIAWAVAEYLHDFKGVGIKTLFATHYHELTALSRTRGRVKNYNVAVKEWQNDIVFFHKLVPGGANRSYGIQVARLAGLPVEVTERAKEILQQIEKDGGPTVQATSKAKSRRSVREAEAGMQLSLFKPSLEWLRERILELDLDHVTPMVALQTLHALREQLATGKPGTPAPALPDTTGNG